MASTVKTLKPIELAFWNDYLKRTSPSRRVRTPFIEAAFAGNRKVTDRLIRLYLRGRKIAGSSLVRDFKAAGDPLPRVGNYWIILDSKERPRCLVRTIRIEINRFANIPKRVVLAEGEGDLSIEHWKRVHRNAYSRFLRKWG